MAGAALGTSTVTSFIESAAGVEQGGRTGLTGLVVAVPGTAARGAELKAAVALGESLAGAIIVLMLSGGQALEHYALRSASSVLAALCALKGPLHGGAPGPVLDMLDEIATEPAPSTRMAPPVPWPLSMAVLRVNWAPVTETEPLT